VSTWPKCLLEWHKIEKREEERVTVIAGILIAAKERAQAGGWRGVRGFSETEKEQGLVFFVLLSSRERGGASR